MIGNIQKGNYIKGLLAYHYEKIEEGEASILSTNIYSEEQDKQCNMFLNTFALHNNSKTTDYTFHASLSFDYDDKVTDDLMNDIAQEYMQRMGYRDVPYTIFKHTDTDHQHLHIVASRIDYDGDVSPKKHNKTMLDYKLNLEHCKYLEKKHGLVIASEKYKESAKSKSLAEINMLKYRVSNGLQKAYDNDVSVPQNIVEAYNSFKKQPSDDDLKELVGQKVFRQAYSLLNNQGLLYISKKERLTRMLQANLERAESLEHFISLSNNDMCYARLMNNKGTPYIKYGYTDDEDNSQAFFKEGSLNKEELTYNYLKHLVENRQESIRLSDEKSQRAYLKRHLNKVLYSVRNVHELEMNLRAMGIGYEFVYTNKGQTIQGMRFQGKADGKWFKATEINRDFSWNKIQNRFDNHTAIRRRKEQKPFEIADKSATLKNIVKSRKTKTNKNVER